MKSYSSTFKFFLIFLIISLLLHLGLLVWFSYLKPSAGRIDTKKESVSVIFVKPKTIAPASPSPGLELADLPKPKVEQVPEKARFVSPYNVKVEKETTALRPPPDAKENVEVSGATPKHPKSNSQPKQEATPQTQEKPKSPSPKQPDDSRKATPDSSQEANDNPSPTLQDLELKPQDFSKPGSSEKPGPSKGKSEKSNSSSTSKKFVDLKFNPNFSEGESGPVDQFAQDFLAGVKIGDKTYVNAFGLPDAHYFARMKRAFRLRFNPRDPLIQYYRNSGKLPSQVVTQIAMEVNPNGNLDKAYVLKTSGISGYDQEVLQTIRASSPFSSPPKKFCDTDGKLKMTWNFITYIN